MSLIQTVNKVTQLEDGGVARAHYLAAVKLYSILWMSNVQECNSMQVERLLIANRKYLAFVLVLLYYVL